MRTEMENFIVETAFFRTGTTEQLFDFFPETTMTDLLWSQFT